VDLIHASLSSAEKLDMRALGYERVLLAATGA